MPPLDIRPSIEPIPPEPNILIVSAPRQTYSRTRLRISSTPSVGGNAYGLYSPGPLVVIQRTPPQEILGPRIRPLFTAIFSPASSSIPRAPRCLTVVTPDSRLSSASL